MAIKTKMLLIILGVFIVVGGLIGYFTNQEELISFQETEFNYYNLTLRNESPFDNPTQIIFYADEIIFENSNITITWNESGVLELEKFDKMIWNIGNKTFEYVLSEVSE